MAVESMSGGSGGMLGQWWRVGGAGGILFVILVIIAAVIQGEPPMYDESTNEIRDWFVDNGEQYLIGDYLFGIAFIIFFLPFLAALRSTLAAAEGGGAIWSWVAFISGLVLIITGAAASVFWGALAFSYAVVEEGDDGTLRTLMYLDYYGFASTNPLALAGVALGSSIVIATTGVLWRWLAALGAVVVVVGVIGPLAVLDKDPEGPLAYFAIASFLVGALWVLLTGLAMLLKAEEPSAV